jgi:putative hydrolase of the HAD superfamily
MPQPTRIRGIVFDLDGTLYVTPDFADTIQDAAVRYISKLNGESLDYARQLISSTRKILTDTTGWEPTLSAVCTKLGGNVRDLHIFFNGCLQPEVYLTRDERVIALLERLAQRMPLYLYTNNNRAMTTRIICILGLSQLFRCIYTIDDTWKGKPDADMLDKLLEEAELKPAEALFVGDRYDVDLKLPAQRGCPIYLSRSVEQLLLLEEILRPD